MLGAGATANRSRVGGRSLAIDSEGSLIDSDGALRHFSRSALRALAMDLNRCFVCGKTKSEAPFNDEHVVPDWVLRRFALHSRRLTLPNGRRIMYGRYTLRCCVGCNSLLGTKIEVPMSRLLSGTFEEVARKLEEAEPTLLYRWLCSTVYQEPSQGSRDTNRSESKSGIRKCGRAL